MSDDQLRILRHLNLRATLHQWTLYPPPNPSPELDGKKRELCQKATQYMGAFVEVLKKASAEEVRLKRRQRATLRRLIDAIFFPLEEDNPYSDLGSSGWKPLEE